MLRVEIIKYEKIVLKNQRYLLKKGRKKSAS
jgi:hypothetical protein